MKEKEEQEKGLSPTKAPEKINYKQNCSSVELIKVLSDYYSNLGGILTAIYKITESNKLKENLQEIATINKEFEEKFKSFQNLLSETSTKLIEAINRQFSGLIKLRDYFKEIPKTYKEAFDVAKIEGYLISLEQLLMVAGTIVHNKEKSVDEVLTTVYNEELFRNMMDWGKGNPYFEKRKRIFEESVKAYLNDDYYLTIYSLLPQIEGLVWDFLMAHLKREELDKIKGSPKIILNTLQENFLNQVMQNFAIEILKVGFGNDCILLTLFANKNLLECRGDEFNRHAILHGVSTQFGSKENALKVILLVDFTLSAVKYLEKI